MKVKETFEVFSTIKENASPKLVAQAACLGVLSLVGAIATGFAGTKVKKIGEFLATKKEEIID